MFHSSGTLDVQSHVTTKYVSATYGGVTPKVAKAHLWQTAPVLWRGYNTFMFDGIAILANLLAGKDTRANGLYFEYENTTNPGGIVIPTIDPEAGTEYYRTLGAGKDYLRVSAQVDGAVETSGAPYKANRVSFMGFSGGAQQGVNGTPFSSVASSCVYGAALVYLADDPANDLIYGRLYSAGAAPIAENQQATARWVTTLYRRD